MSSPASLRPSRFNFSLPVDDGVVLYNAASGGVMHLGGPHAAILSELLTTEAAGFDEALLPDALAGQLARSRFVVDEADDEVEAVRTRFWRARRQTPMVVTVTTTMDCNLGCYYCYEDRTGDRLALDDVPALLAVVQERFARAPSPALHVDWYGGEPLLNAEFMEAATPALLELCAARGISYSASIISNGTCWPDDAGAFVRRHRIRQVQITFDGLRVNHDRRRRYRRGRAHPSGDSSFDRAVDLVDRLLDHVRVDVRFNIDGRNRDDLLPFIAFVRERGWFARPYPAVFQPARVSAYSERSAFMRAAELATEEYDALRASVRAALAGVGAVEESEAPEGVPLPRSSVCAALAEASVVVGADMREYRCGLQVSEPNRATSARRTARPRQLPVLTTGGDGAWWAAFDPTRQPQCSRCSFLPICWGGCPKKHLEGDTHALAEQSAYWRANLPRLIARAAGRPAPPGFRYTEADQFRD